MSQAIKLLTGYPGYACEGAGKAHAYTYIISVQRNSDWEPPHLMLYTPAEVLLAFFFCVL